MPEAPRPIACSVGVIAYNEERNIGGLLDRLVGQETDRVAISEIVVVASGCTDRTVAIVREAMARSPRIRLIEQARREGKTSAVNAFLAAATREICVVESGDTLPGGDAVERLVRPFEDPRVGMVGPRKVAVNPDGHPACLLNHLRLRLEHRLCGSTPRLGEMIAFRKVFDGIPADVAMDEAFVEAAVTAAGLEVRYAPGAVVFNAGPATLVELVRQRRRNHAGHLHLKHRYGYRVGSLRNRQVLGAALAEYRAAFRVLYGLTFLAALEFVSRLLGWYDFAVARNLHVVWQMAWTQKLDVQSFLGDRCGLDESAGRDGA